MTSTDQDSVSLTSSDFISGEESSDDDILEKGTLDFQKDLVILSKLKFQNTIFQSGDSIALRLDEKDEKLVYGKIVMIGKSGKAPFPIIKIAWYYSKFDGFADSEAPFYLSKHELVLTDHADWQYLESIVKKINVLSLSQYEELSYFQRENSGIFFMRSHLYSADQTMRPTPRVVCHCLKLYNPDEKLITCLVCGFDFHRYCGRNGYICNYCQ